MIILGGGQPHGPRLQRRLRQGAGGHQAQDRRGQPIGEGEAGPADQ